MPVEQIIEAAEDISFWDVLETLFAIIEFPAVTLLTAVLIEILLPISSSWKLTGLVFYFEKISRKVNKKENSTGQIIFSSIVLPFFILVVALLIAFFLRFVINYDAIVALLVLPFVMDSKYCFPTALKVKHALLDGKKDKARQQLQTIMHRDCSKLSEMGINKALSEAIGMSVFANWFSVLVWYMLLGIEGAVMMQLVAVMARAFSIKKERYVVFGAFSYKVEQIMLLPAAVCLFVMMLFSISCFRVLRNFISHITMFSSSTSGLILDWLGSYANVSLGGPRYYGTSLIRLPRFGGVNNPDIKTPLKIYNKMRFCGILFVCVCVLVSVFVTSDLSV